MDSSFRVVALWIKQCSLVTMFYIFKLNIEQGQDHNFQSKLSFWITCLLNNVTESVGADKKFLSCRLMDGAFFSYGRTNIYCFEYLTNFCWHVWIVCHFSLYIIRILFLSVEACVHIICLRFFWTVAAISNLPTLGWVVSMARIWTLCLKPTSANKVCIFLWIEWMI